MKTIFNLCLSFLAAVLPATAQSEQPTVGFVRIVNAVAAGEGNLQVKLDGSVLLARGYALGQRTGGIGLPAGGHVIEFAKAGVGAVRETLAVTNGESLTLLAYAEKLPVTRENPSPAWTIKLRKLAAVSADRGYHLHLISLCDREELVVQTTIEARRKTETTALRRFQPAEVDLGRSRGGVEVQVGGEPLAAVSLDDPGRYVVVLYEDATGGVKTVVFYDPKFEVAG